MKTCSKCKVRLGYVNFVNHRCYTVKEWKKLSSNPVQANTNKFQFINFFTKRKESYDYITTAEIILSRHNVFLNDHLNRRKIGGFAKSTLKETLRDGLKSLPSKMTQENLQKGIKTFDKGVDMFNKGVQDFSKQMEDMTKGLGGDPKNNKKNLDSIWGGKKSSSTPIWGGKKSSSVKIWSDKPTPRRRKGTRSSTPSNVDLIWGKKK